MAPKKCNVPDCSSTEGTPGISLHQVWGDWFNANKAALGFRPHYPLSKTSRICNLHFTLDSFISTGPNRKQLVVDPTLLVNCVELPDSTQHSEREQDKLYWQDLMDQHLQRLDTTLGGYHTVVRGASISFIRFELDFATSGESVQKAVVIVRNHQRNELQAKLFMNGQNIKLSDPINTWTALAKLLSDDPAEAEVDPTHVIATCVKSLSSITFEAPDDEEDEVNDSDHGKKRQDTRLKIIVELLENFMKPGNNNRYSRETYLMAFIFKSLSRSCYDSIREYFDLPHPSRLEALSRSLNSSDNKQYFTSLANGMNYQQRHVGLFVDEMKVKENARYNNEKIFGLALNDTEHGKDTVARHIMTWFIHSQAGPMKECVRMVPESCMTSAEIATTTLDIVMELATLGFVVTLNVFDGASTNVKAVEILTDDTIRPGSKLNLFYPHPHLNFTGCKIFTSFDHSHEIKKICNGWRNKRDSRKTYLVPRWADVTVAQAAQERGVDISQWHYIFERAEFQALRDIYNAEANSITKKAFKLDFQTMYPTVWEKQIVRLADNIFHQSTSAALKAFGQIETMNFCDNMRRLHKMCNVRGKFQGERNREDDNKPFFRHTYKTDPRFLFLKQMIVMLDVMQDNPDSNFELDGKTYHYRLTNQAYHTLRISIATTIEYIPYMFEKLPGLEYYLTGKMLSDCIENFFGKLRTLCGWNHDVTVLECEWAKKKLRDRKAIKTIMTGTRTNNVDFDMARNLEELIDTINGLEDLVMDDYDVIKNFVPVEKAQLVDLMTVLDHYEDQSINLEQENAAYIAGATTKRALKGIACVECRAILCTGKGSVTGDIYHDKMNRGGLLVASDTAEFMTRTAICLMLSIAANADLKKSFHRLTNHKTSFLTLLMTALERNMDMSDICGICDLPFVDLVTRYAAPTSTLMMSCYCKRMTQLNAKAIQQGKIVASEKRASAASARSNATQQSQVTTQAMLDAPLPDDEDLTDEAMMNLSLENIDQPSTSTQASTSRTSQPTTSRTNRRKQNLVTRH